jgi:hypothetical protein
MVHVVRAWTAFDHQRRDNSDEDSGRMGDRARCPEARGHYDETSTTTLTWHTDAA